MQSMGKEEWSKNFWVLKNHDLWFLQLCSTAECYYLNDPNTAVIKVGQFGGAVINHLVAVFGA